MKYRRHSAGRGYQGRRLTIRGWLIERGLRPEQADGWCDAWEETVRARDINRDDPAYWSGAATWIAEQIEAAKRTS